MVACLNKSAVQYQTLKNRSGISEQILDAYCRKYLDEYNRWPNLDELPKSNSTKFIQKVLKLKDNVTSVETILEFTGKKSINEAVIELNKQFKDKEIDILPIGLDAIVKITDRPTLYTSNISSINLDLTINTGVALNQILSSIAKKYGIQIIPINNAQLLDGNLSKLHDALLANGFIYNGNIYINTDNYSPDTLIHEMGHLFIGSIRFSNPELYSKLLDKAKLFPGYDYLAKLFIGRTLNDINEEILISEVSKLLASLPNEISNIDEITIKDIIYEAERILDSIFMGNLSVKTLSNLYIKTIKDVLMSVGSLALSNKFSLSLDEAGIHRTLNNTKAKLIEDNELKEEC